MHRFSFLLYCSLSPSIISFSLLQAASLSGTAPHQPRKFFGGLIVWWGMDCPPPANRSNATGSLPLNTKGKKIIIASHSEIPKFGKTPPDDSR
jgi:hypothetical protein